MLITLSRRSAICQSVAEVYLTGVASLGAVSHRFNFFKYLKSNNLKKACHRMKKPSNISTNKSLNAMFDKGFSKVLV